MSRVSWVWEARKVLCGWFLIHETQIKLAEDKISLELKTLTAERDGALAVASAYMRERDKERAYNQELREKLCKLEEARLPVR